MISAAEYNGRQYQMPLRGRVAKKIFNRKLPTDLKEIAGA